MKAAGQPLNYVWWLAGRASGVVALVLIAASVTMGLALAAKAVTSPRAKRLIAKLHEHVALSALGAIGVHGVSLLKDPWLRPGWRGITVPFAMSYRPFFTGLGIIGAYLALVLGPSFYLRRRIGARRWRKLHSFLVLAWLMSAAHTLGAGSDGSKMWLEAVVAAPVVPIVYLLVLKALKPDVRPAVRRAGASGSSDTAAHPTPEAAVRADPAGSEAAA